MTEESYQQCRKVMQQINHLRGLITAAKGEVAKWTAMEMHYRQNLQEAKADGAKKMLLLVMKKLEERRQKFSEMKFPDSNIMAVKKEAVQCDGCGAKIAKGNTYCGECLCED